MSSPQANSTEILVDDRDSGISYSPSASGSNWWRGTTCGDAAATLDGTTTGTAVQGATATYQFNGTGIAVYGTIAPSSPWTAEFVIENYASVGFVAQSLPGYATNQLFFQSPALPGGLHTLVVTITEIVAPRSYCMDYLVVQPEIASDPTPTSTSTTSTSSPSSSTTSTTLSSPFTTLGSASSTGLSNSKTSSSSSSGTRTSASAPSGSSSASATIPPDSSSPSPSSTSASHHSSSAALIGGVVGGVVVLILLAALLFFCRRRRVRRVRTASGPKDILAAATYDQYNDGAASRSSIVPYTLSSSATARGPPMMAEAGTARTSRPSALQLISSVSGSPRPEKKPLLDAGLPAPAEQSSPRAAAEPQTIIYEDGGVRLARAGQDAPGAWEEVRELPPAYRNYDAEQRHNRALENR